MLSTQQFHGVRYQGERFDCGDKLGFLQANVALGLARSEFSTPLRAFLEMRLKTRTNG
jgi:UTP-glucose-1-phosphate uridylyltransferase